jgi:uncharacterized protein (TIGR02270 family)
MEPVMMDILEEHLDEAAFLSTQWERALVSSRYGLEDTAELEERLFAHVDGLVVGGETAVSELLLPGLETDEPERIFASALALLESPGQRELDETLAVFDAGDAVQRMGLGRAMELSGREGLEAVLRKRLTAEDSALRLQAFQTLALRGEVPPETRTEWLYREDAGQVVAALRVPRALSRELGQTVLPQLLVDPRPGVREAAILAGLVSGVRGAWKACRKVAEEGGSGRRQCLVALALGGEAQDAEWLAGMLAQPALRADVLWALGFTGQVVAAEACLEWMGDGKLGALAAEAFSAITGLKLEGPYRVALEEQGDALVPLEQEDLEAELIPSPEADLAVPVREAVVGWWQQARKNFERGARYMRGTKLDAGGLLDALGSEPMRRRAVLALELAIRSRGAQVLQVRAFTRRQRAELEAARAAVASVSMSPFTKLFGG